MYLPASIGGASGFPLDLEKMRVHLENLEISWNFEKFNKYHGKMTWNLGKNLVATKNSPLTPLKQYKIH